MTECIDEFADPEFQQQVWVEASRPGVQATYTEALVGLYNDAQANYLIEFRQASKPRKREGR